MTSATDNFNRADGVFPRDEFVRHTICIDLDTLGANEAGNARVRFWQNAALLTDNGNIRTLINSTDYADALYLFSYWNGAAPKDQSLWIDALRVAAGTGTPSWAADLEGV